MKPRQEFPTLFDKVYASCLVENQSDAFFPPDELRRRIFAARRFACDDSMSRFMGDVSSRAFETKTTAGRFKAIEAMRMGARLPHKSTWVEYNLRECHRHLRHYTNRTPDGKGVVDLSEIPLQEGWLIETHPQIETAFRATIYVGDDRLDENGFDCWAFPWAYCWVTDDSVMPWKENLKVTIMRDGESTNEPGDLTPLIVGLTGYHRPDHVGVQLCSPGLAASQKHKEKLVYLLREWGGVVRRIWAFLSTINDVPVIMRDVKPAKGYFARRNYRKFLDHKIITLKVPQADYVKLARSVVAKARRRAHMVRGHWRKDRWRPGERIWIAEHQRGDASLGFVTHDYAVTHKPVAKEETRT